MPCIKDKGYEMKDNMETIHVDMSDDTFFYISDQAHKNDITFNQMVQKILEQEIERVQEEKDKERFEKIVEDVLSWA